MLFWLPYKVHLWSHPYRLASSIGRVSFWADMLLVILLNYLTQILQLLFEAIGWSCT